MIDFDDALQMALSESLPLPAKEIPITEAVGRILAGDIEAPVDLPPYAKATIDGFAIYSEDAKDTKAIHEVIGTVSAGIFHHHQTVLASYQSSIVLKRGAKVGTIVQSENELRIIEGKFDLDDVFVFSTQNGRQFIDQISLNFERGYDSDGVITAIVPALHSLTDSSTAALAFVAVTQEEPMAESPVPTMEIDLQSNDDQESLAISLSAGQSSSKVNQELSQTTTLAQAQAAADDSGITIGQPLSSSKKQYFLHRKNILDTTLRGFAVAITIGRRLGQTGVQTATQIIQSFSSKTYLGAPPSKKMIRLAILAVVIVLFLALLGWFFWARNKQLEAAALAIAQPFRVF